MRKLHLKNRFLSSPFKWFALTAACSLCLTTSAARSAVTLEADPDFPAFPAFVTTNTGAINGPEHAFINDRALRQTFKIFDEIDIGQIVLALNLTEADTGLNVNFFEIDDVNAETWVAGNPVTSFTIPTTQTLPATNARLGISLTGSDVITLAPRNEGTTGYGLEISYVDTALVTSGAGWVVSPNDGVDRYADGIFYTETDAFSRVARDAGLAFVEEGAPPVVDGDINNDGEVDLDDFDVITTNFRTIVGTRSEGDLTGDGFVDFADFREWKSHYPDASLAAGLAIPEPPSGLLLMISLLLGAFAVRVRMCGSAVMPLVPLRKLAPAAATGFVLFVMASSTAWGTVTLMADPEAWPEDAPVFTLDPEATPSTAARNVAADRMLRQTFQVDETFFVGGIMLSFGSGGQDTGFNMSFFEVADVNAEMWEPIGNPIKRISIPIGEDIPISSATNRMLFTLTGSDSFTLPAILTETGGYGIEISSGDLMTNMGPLRHANTDGGAPENADDYLRGKFYTESGGQSGPGGRDIGLALIATDIQPPGPGDVDEDLDVDLDDLTIIRMHMREAVAGRTEGDLSGDGFVDVDDFREWKDNYVPPAGGQANFAIPEPTSAGLAISVVLLALAAAARRRA